MTPELVPLLTVFFAVLGSMVGSHLNVVVHRFPLGISTVHPKSRCPRCLMPVRPWHNVPVLGWLWLRGRCRDCRVRISVRYPLVEAVTGALFVAALRRGAGPVDIVAGCLLVSTLVTLALIDLDVRGLPDSITLPATLIGLGLAPWVSWTSWADAWIGAVAGAVGLFVASELWRWVRGEPGMGDGDIKMLAMLGAFLGWRGALASLLVASLLAVAAAGITKPWTADFEKRGVPFGTFLSLGGLVVWLLRERLWGVLV